MSTNNEKPVNAGKPWSQEEIDLIAKLVPNWENANLLASVLGRTPHAIQYMWSKLYWSVKMLKEHIDSDTSSEHYQKILNARRKANICIRNK